MKCPMCRGGMTAVPANGPMGVATVYYTCPTDGWVTAPEVVK